jgi:hypothetical protein
MLVYNEAGNIASGCEKLSQVLNGLALDFEVVAVHDVTFTGSFAMALPLVLFNLHWVTCVNRSTMFALGAMRSGA